MRIRLTLPQPHECNCAKKHARIISDDALEQSVSSSSTLASSARYCCAPKCAHRTDDDKNKYPRYTPMLGTVTQTRFVHGETNVNITPLIYRIRSSTTTLFDFLLLRCCLPLVK